VNYLTAGVSTVIPTPRRRRQTTGAAATVYRCHRRHSTPARTRRPPASLPAISPPIPELSASLHRLGDG